MSMPPAGHKLAISSIQLSSTWPECSAIYGLGGLQSVRAFGTEIGGLLRRWLGNPMNTLAKNRLGRNCGALCIGRFPIWLGVVAAAAAACGGSTASAPPVSAMPAPSSVASSPPVVSAAPIASSSPTASGSAATSPAPSEEKPKPTAAETKDQPAAARQAQMPQGHRLNPHNRRPTRSLQRELRFSSTTRTRTPKPRPLLLAKRTPRKTTRRQRPPACKRRAANSYRTFSYF